MVKLNKYHANQVIQVIKEEQNLKETPLIGLDADEGDS